MAKSELSGPIDLIKKSFKIFFKKENFIYFMKVYSPIFVFSLLYTLAGNSGLMGDFKKGNFNFFSDKPFLIALFVLFVILVLVGSIWIQAISLESVLRVVNSDTLDFKKTYRTAWVYAFRLFLASAIVDLIVFGGFILLIIPGIIFSIWFAFVRFDIADGELIIRKSFNKSKALVKGRFWAVLGRLFVFGFFSGLVGFIVALVPYAGSSITALFGALFILPYYLLYKELSA